MDVASLKKDPTAVLPLLSTTAWILVGIALLVLIALALVAVLWWRRRRARSEPPSPPVTTPPPLGKVMAHDWRMFRRGLPPRARRSLDHFHPVVVLGTESSGKGELVERFSGVAQRRADLGAVAARPDGYLRLALGTDALFVELSEEVTCAARVPVEAGLRKVLGPVLRRRVPLVVVCLSPESFDRQSEQKLTELGSALRSKLDAIAALSGEPIRVRVVIADVPGSARLDPLFRLVQLPGVPAVIPLGDAHEDGLRARLLRYGDELGVAFSDLAPGEALDVVGFLSAAPELARALSLVLGEMFTDAGDSDGTPPPAPEALYLVPAHGGPNPLIVPAELARPGPSPLLRHRVLAFSAAAALTGALLAAYHQRAEAWTRASAAAWTYEVTAENELDLRAVIRGYTGPDQAGIGELVLPRFFAHGPDVVACSFVEQVRQDVLVDQLEDGIAVAATRRRPEEPLYRAALLYATGDGDLNRVIGDRVDDWASAIGLEPSLVDDYLRLAGPYRDRGWIERLRVVAATPFDDVAERDVSALLGVLADASLLEQQPLDALVASATRVLAEVRDLQRYGAAQRVLASELFHPLATSFAHHARHMEFLAELWENRTGLESVLTAVIDASLPDAERRVTTLAELVAAVGPLLEAPVVGGQQVLVLGATEYRIEPSNAIRVLQHAAAERLIAAFLDQPRADIVDALVPAVPVGREPTVPLPIARAAGIEVLDRMDRRFTREAFEQWVRPTSIALSVALERLDQGSSLRRRLHDYAQAAVNEYARRYEAELEGVYASFRIDAPSEAAAQRVLRTLAGAASPLRELPRTVAYHAALGAGGGPPLLDVFTPIQDRFGALAAIVDESKGDPPLVAYQDILAGALAALVAPPPPAAPAPGPAAPGAALAPELSASGRMTLELMTDADKSAMALARAWAAANGLGPELAAPFLAPLEELQSLGAAEIQGAVIARVRDLEPALRAELLSRFPFAADGDDVEPDVVTAWLHPVTGRIAVEVIGPLDPLLIRRGRVAGGRVVYVPSQRCDGETSCVSVPGDLLDRINRLAAVTGLLWDEAGKPRSLAVAVTPRPYRVRRGALAPALVRLTAGDDEVLYFNQRPSRRPLAVDWTQSRVASLSLQLDEDGAGALTPPSLSAGDGPWSLFRLLELAERRGPTRTWRVPVDDRRAVPVTFDVADAVSPVFRAAAGAPRAHRPVAMRDAP